MKLSIYFCSLVLASCAHHSAQNLSKRGPSSDAPSAMFSPWEGAKAFETQYQAIAKAKLEARITVYSWSDAGLDRAIEAAILNGANVRVVMHQPLGEDVKVMAKVTRLENFAGPGKVDFKLAPRNMHEKFILVDGEFLVNSSANFSGGAKTKYSENFVFMTGPQYVLKSFENEFATIWNSGTDIITGEKDVVEARLPYDGENHYLPGRDIVLYSSSMNYDYEETTPEEALKGTFVKLMPKGGGRGPYIVRDALVGAINNATASVSCSLNHFNMNYVSKALVEAAKRGVDVRMTVDNQEYLEKWNPQGIEQTPYFVENWKKIPGNEEKTAPVRVKFYSLAPNPLLWLLNHHKFCLVDNGTPKAVLFTGSYNISETAEHRQFDNLVGYNGEQFSALHQQYQVEFDKLWGLERKDDRPSSEAISFFTTPIDNSLPVHNTRAVSLSFEEITDLRTKIKTLAPTFLERLNRDMSSCKGFELTKQEILGCDPKP